MGVGYDGTTHKFFYTADAEQVREVYRKFLSGNQNYDALSEILGMTRGSARNVLENPIYAGWLVIDEKRDLSPAAKRVGPDGRRRDRRKIQRAPEEIIRQRVFDEPLISQADFDRVQILIQHKAERSAGGAIRLLRFLLVLEVWCSPAHPPQPAGQLLLSLRGQETTE